MDLFETRDFDLFISYVKRKNDSMYPKMWDDSLLTKDAFDKMYGNYRMFLAMVDGRTIGGFVLLDHDYSYWNEKDNEDEAYYIHKIFVLKEYNGLKYGHEMIYEVANIAVANKKDYIRLDCRKHLTSLNNYYEEIGFGVVREMESPISGTMNLRQAILVK